MPLHGQQIIAGTHSALGRRRFSASDPSTGAVLPPEFFEGTPEEIDAALCAAAEAFEQFRAVPGRRIAELLESAASEIEALGDDLIHLAHTETGLPLTRLQGERARMLGGVRIFATMAREESWRSARIDRGDPARPGSPKPDVRSMLTALGPVVVFGASNFPLAISVAGTDTVSALAAGCPVVVKAHPGHPGTSELVAGALTRAVARSGLPAGIFSMVQGAGHEVGLTLVRHDRTRAVAFTGSHKGGRALFDAAASRPHPIPVYAEMGSINPVILLPGALAERAAAIAAAYVQSVTLGVGQFCTNPGLVFGFEGESLEEFTNAAARAAEAFSPATMLHSGIRDAFTSGTARFQQTPGVEVIARSRAQPDPRRTEAPCVIVATTAETLAAHPHLSEEVFGPLSAVVRCRDKRELEQAIRGLAGHLTASVHGTTADLAEYSDVIQLLETKVGRIIFNGFGTGIEVCAAMHHGGPYPATTDPHFTSIGHAAIFRFARPICYQNFPNAMLPDALKDGNPLGLWRLVEGQLTRDG
jgi:alpha-ketoglutaric semialdehyde dehydrogenase